MGPMASQESIKELGTDGGGFVNANSAHPYENPTALSNFLEMFAIMLIPMGLTYTFGRMVGDTRKGWAEAATALQALMALLVCLIPTTIGGLLSAIGVAGMSRMLQANVVATCGRAVEAAGDVDVLLLDEALSSRLQASSSLTWAWC